MNLFDDMEAIHAAMYRWVRKTMTRSMFAALTGQEAPTDMRSLETDRIIREAFEKHETRDVMAGITERSKIRSGILPHSLGLAVSKYTSTVHEAALFEEGLGSKTHGDMNSELRLSFLALCEEMAKLR